MPVIVSFVGRSESGKTTLIEKLIPVLLRRGLRVGTIKHTHHTPELDRSGKDSARHLAAGASTVVLASSGQIQLVKTGVNGGLGGLVRYFDDVDLLITEGFKQERTPKIEVLRRAVSDRLLCRGRMLSCAGIATRRDVLALVNFPYYRIFRKTVGTAFRESAMAEESTLTSKGQTTIPKGIRDKLAMKSGDRMTFTVMPDGTVLAFDFGEKRIGVATGETLLGSARMVLETGLHPGVLKDMVTSPGGTTIEGLHELEKAGLRGALINAVRAAADKSGKLGRG